MESFEHLEMIEESASLFDDMWPQGRCILKAVILLECTPTFWSEKVIRISSHSLDE
jgi:hypothetical protein